MNKPKIIQLLKENYNSFEVYVSELTEQEYHFSFEGKWAASQQLSHIILCIEPLIQVFNMDKPAIGALFGSTERAGRSYDNLLTDYKKKLAGGGKAPGRFVPETVLNKDRTSMTSDLTKMTEELCLAVDRFSEEELDSLLIPHPLLGNLTMREMLYNAIYHVNHHHEQSLQNLQNKA
jgi:hypothetical protein